MFLALLFAAILPAATAADNAALAKVFATLEKALRDADEPAFKAQWDPEAYEKNLIGGSGTTGKSVFRQGSRKKWFLKPDLSKTRDVSDGVVIVPCAIWSWEQDKAVDAVHALLVRTGGKWVMIGGGEKLDEVKAAAEAAKSRVKP